MTKISKGTKISKKEGNPASLGSLLPQINFLLFQVFIVFIANSRLSGEDDLFWYLSTGRYILQSGSVPSYDVFGFTTSGLPWIPFEWAWDVMNFLLYNTGGFFALSIFSTLIILVIFNLLYLLMKKLHVNNSLIFFYLTVLALGISQRLTVKPHLISYLFLVILLTILARYKYLNRNDNKILYFIPLVFLVWVNLHMGVLSGLFMLGLFFISELAGTAFRSRLTAEAVSPLSKKQLFRLGLIIFASALAVLVNPHGLETFRYASHIVSMKQLDFIYEWQSPFSDIYLSSVSNYFYYFFIFSSVLALLFAWKRKDIFPILLCLGYFLYSLTAARLTIDFMIVTVTFSAVAVNYYVNKRKSKREMNYRFYPALSVLTLLLILIILIPSNNLYRTLDIKRTFGTGIESSNFPVKMYGFIKSSGLDSIAARPFNTYETGGYFIWYFPNRKNFIGSRGINDEVWDDYETIINIKPGFEEKLKKMDFDYFTWMVPFVNYAQNPGLLDQGLLSYLFKNESWKLVYWDDISFMFVKNEEKFDKYLVKNEYKILNPYNFYADYPGMEKALTENRAEFLKELDRKKAEDPAGIFTGIMVRYFEKKLK